MNDTSGLVDGLLSVEGNFTLTEVAAPASFGAGAKALTLDLDASAVIEGVEVFG